MINEQQITLASFSPVSLELQHLKHYLTAKSLMVDTIVDFFFFFCTMISIKQITLYPDFFSFNSCD